MGNLVCLNCFKTGLEEGGTVQPVQVMPDRDSDIQILEDADVLSHFDLQQLQFENREKQNKEKRSFFRVHAAPSYCRSQSLKVIAKSRPMRYSLNMKRQTDDKTVAFGNKNDTQPKGDNYYSSYFSGLDSESQFGQKPPLKASNFKPPFVEPVKLEIDQTPIRRSSTLKHQKSAEFHDLAGRGSFANKKKIDGHDLEKSRGSELKELDEFKNILDSNIPSPVKEPQNFIVTTGNKKSLIDPRQIGASGKKSEDTIKLKEEERDVVHIGSLTQLTVIPPKSSKLSPEMRSMKSLSIEPSLYSFKSCNEFDNLTFNSLLSSKSTSKRICGSKIKKQDIFHEFMFEIEQFADYFNLSNTYPLEEVLFDKKGTVNRSEKYLATFCPKVIEVGPDNALSPLAKKRVIISRGIFILKTSIRELQVSLNKKVEGVATRFVQKRLFN